MRGKVVYAIDFTKNPRITPAHAGKSRKTPKVIGGIKDHPRTCGEKLVSLFLMFQKIGSPPHMRGKAFKESTATIATGITPAHAGKRVSVMKTGESP